MFCNENLYYLLSSCTNSIFGEILVHEIHAKMFSANQIAGFSNQLYLKTNQWNNLIFGMAKWVWPVWSRDSKIGCISRMNRWNELIFCMVVQIQESRKLFKWFLGGPGQKWAWSFSSWYPKICRISLWIELIFCMLTVMQ